MSDDILTVHVWARGTPQAGRKFDGPDLGAAKDAGLVLSYTGTPIELQALSNNCNIHKRGPHAAFDAALSESLREAAMSAAPIVVPDETPEEPA